jgi:8-oxo-dGTP pyrophosphatase MutT (NUDIX family)
LSWIKSFIENFSSSTLPGSHAQSEMSGFGRPNVPISEHAKNASVLLLFYPEGAEYNLCFIKRSSRYPEDPHSGQIAFPGGQEESVDESLWHTALREAQEEVGVDANAVQRIGPLTSLYIPISNFLVHPYMGYLEEAPKFSPQESEVQEIITPKVSSILHPGTIKKADLTLGKNKRLKNVPHFYLEKNIVWGATAMILNEFKACAIQFTP